MEWIDARFPATKMWEDHLSKYYAPKNFNFFYFFGSLALLVLVNQILTGIWLTMSFTPSAEEAFASVEYIMRDVEYGAIIRYLHSTGASAFFIVVYMHMFRGLLYGSYQKPRELVWIFGMLIYLALMAEAFMGYLLPWGQMSYWGAQVIISLFGAIPVIGGDLTQWIRGDYLISGITLNRFFALHVIALPIVILGLVVLHILALHEVGSNNPDGVDIKKLKDENGIPLDGIAFHPYYSVKDIVGVVVFLFVFCFVVFFFPEMGGYFLEKPNFEQANPFKTPEHIAPVWYFTPFYAILRAVPDKLMGVIAMGAAIAVLFVLPWLDRSPVKSMRYKGWLSKIWLLVFCVSFVILGVLGVLAPTPGRTLLSQDGKNQTGSGKGDRLMKKLFAAFVIAALPALTFAAGGHDVELDHVDIDLTDKAALQDGARTFANYCMGCHSAKFQRYERVAKDLGIPEELMLENLVFTGAKIGDHMQIGMKPSDAKTWFGAAPPDLTLVARLPAQLLRRSGASLGVNNKIFPNVGMPNVLVGLQGRQVVGCKQVQAVEEGKKQYDPLTGAPITHEACDQLTIVPKTGKLSEAEFDQKVQNLVTFLAYSADPNKLHMQRIGTYVLLYLAFFFVFAYLLKREYWKDVH
ncbi:hypothetical protein Lal_00007128 [Lupinus albus]|nr:hypothetical protein Lal_00007128 [Lupinus albus]